MDFKNSFGFLGGLVRMLALKKILFLNYRSGSGLRFLPGNAKDADRENISGTGQSIGPGGGAVKRNRSQVTGYRSQITAYRLQKTPQKTEDLGVGGERAGRPRFSETRYSGTVPRIRRW